MHSWEVTWTESQCACVLKQQVDECQSQILLLAKEEGGVEANDSLNVSFHLRAIFKMSFRNSMILPATLSEIFLFCSSGVFACCERCPCHFLSHVPWLVGVVFGPVLLSWMRAVFGPLLDIWHLFPCLFCWYSNNLNHWSKSGNVDNHQNYRSKSGICCRVQTIFLRVDGCCCISVHVPTSFCCCEMQPLVLGDEKCQSVF